MGWRVKGKVDLLRGEEPWGLEGSEYLVTVRFSLLVTIDQTGVIRTGYHPQRSDSHERRLLLCLPAKKKIRIKASHRN